MPRTTQVGLCGGSYHHLATLDPARANPKPLAPLKQPNMVVTISKCDGKKENNEEKHLLGVFREEQQGSEMPRIVAREQSK